jgi:hypothetical protein
MNQAVRYLGKHPLLTTAGALGYAAAVTLSHDAGQNLTFWLQDLAGVQRWLAGVKIAAVLLGILGCAWLVSAARRRPDWPVIAVYGVLTVGLALAGYSTLMMVANEVIHFPQYALLAMLVYPLARRFGDTVIWCTLAGLVDEGYQYFVLHEWQGYFDFNDVVLNAVGAGLGVLILRASLPPQEPATLRQALCRPGFLAAGSLLALCFGLATAGLLRILPAAESAAGAIVLRRHGPSSATWIHTHFGTVYHELQPGEAVAVIVAILVLYLGLDLLPAAQQATAAHPMTASRAAVAEADPPQPE